MLYKWQERGQVRYKLSGLRLMLNSAYFSNVQRALAPNLLFKLRKPRYKNCTLEARCVQKLNIAMATVTTFRH
jgi:hypothetical protein